MIEQGNVFKDKHETRYTLLGIIILGHNDKKAMYPKVEGSVARQMSL